MIIEEAILPVVPGLEDAFETAMAKALPLIERQPGCLWVSVSRCVENPSRYLLLVGWETVEAHEESFRKSVDYQEWKRLLHHFYKPFPVVEHYAPVVGSL